MLFSSRLVTSQKTNGRRIEQDPMDPSHRGIHGVNQRDHTTWDREKHDDWCCMEKYGEKMETKWRNMEKQWRNMEKMYVWGTSLISLGIIL